MESCVEIAQSYRIDTSQARVLRDTTNVVVHLAPAPLIARVSMTLGPVRGVQSLENELVRFRLPGVTPRDRSPCLAPAYGGLYLAKRFMTFSVSISTSGE